jgi:hypothetical protein
MKKQCMATKKIPADCMPMCQSCSFFEREKNEDVGICRRYPPSTFFLGDDEFDSLFPVTGPSEWCGEFKRQVS